MCLTYNTREGPQVMVAVEQYASNIVSAVKQSKYFLFFGAFVFDHLTPPNLPGYVCWNWDTSKKRYDVGDDFQRRVVFLYKTEGEHCIDMYNYNLEQERLANLHPWFDYSYIAYCNDLRKQRTQKELNRATATARNLHNKVRKYRRKTEYLLKYKMPEFAHARNRIIYQELMEKTLHPSRMLQWIDEDDL